MAAAAPGESKVLRVTNLNAAGPGSLREAIATPGARIVVFEVGGAINLDRKDLDIREPFLTVAGQTAPSPGITLIRGGLRMLTHDIRLQHIRVRMGDAGQPKKSGYDVEVTTSGPEAYNIVVDHCSFSWAVDENLSISGPRHNGPEGTSRRVTYSHNIIAEGLYNSSHEKGIHSMGTLVHDSATEITIVANLYAHNNQRNPYFKAWTTGAIVNNLIYNPGTRGITVDFVPSEWKGQPVQPINARVAVVGNVLIHGANTKPDVALVMRRGDVYLEDNIGQDRDGKPVPQTSGDIVLLKEKPFWPAGLKALPARQVIEHVTAHAGARPKDRDEVDLRILREFRERKGRLIDSQDDVGGYPKPKPAARKLNVPASGLEAWLAKMAREVE
ncbi:MAG: right-handed parallel beta-helix repeat-containing protein [Acidobacteria bacterium]|nr:right-handed parallel beta-helix repeat-containing protein [Acidobacteriota bacterium]